MKQQLKYLASFIAMLVIPVLSTGASIGNEVSSSSGTTVYICTGPRAETYHRSDRCSGLNRCSGSVIAVSLSNAKEMGRRACKRCY